MPARQPALPAILATLTLVLLVGAWWVVWPDAASSAAGASVSGVGDGDAGAAARRLRAEDGPEPGGSGPGDPSDATTGLAGKIVGAAYTGALARYLVEVGGTRLAVDLHDPRHGPRYVEGDRVTVQLPADPHVLPADSAEL